MNRFLTSTLFAATAAVAFAATVATAAPPAGQLTSGNRPAAQSSAIVPVHDRWQRWHRWGGPHWRPCHWERECWHDRWGYRHCEIVRRCHRRDW